VRSLGVDALRNLWRTTFRLSPPPAFTKDLLARFLCWHIQEQAFGGLDPKTAKHLGDLARAGRSRRLMPGTVLLREYQGERHTCKWLPLARVTYASFSSIARAITGTNWNGPRFFGLRGRSKTRPWGPSKTRPGGVWKFARRGVRPGGWHNPHALTAVQESLRERPTDLTAAK
jgi:hypothetical protein